MNLPQPELNSQKPSNNRKVILRKDQNIQFKTDNSEEWTKARVLGRGGRATGKYKNHFNIEKENNEKVCLDFSKTQYAILEQEEEVSGEEDYHSSEEVLISSKEFSVNEKIEEAKEIEIQNWRNFNVFEETVDKGQSTISTRWVITEKKNVDNTPIIKARLVVRGFEEEDRSQCDSPTASKSTMRTFLLVSANEGWAPQTIDIKSAFLQGKPIERDIYIQPPAGFSENGTIWKLKKVVYGLNDAARNWYFSVAEELQRLGLKQSLVDKALFRSYSDDGSLQGVFLIHVDDFLIAGTQEFNIKIESITKKFKVGRRKEADFKYIGLNVNYHQSCLEINQKDYINEIAKAKISDKKMKTKQEPLNKNETREYRRIVGQLNWAAGQTRPDMLIEVVSLSMCAKHPTIADLILANKAIDKLKSSEVCIKYGRLGSMENLSLRVYTDASWANLPDGTSSAGGYVIYAVGENGTCAPVDWSSNKIQRTVHSTLAAESLAMSTGIDAAIYLGSMLSEIYFHNMKNVFPIDVYTDNKSLQENVCSTKQVKEKRLRVTIAEIRESLERKYINSIQWISSNDQLADCLTKRGASTASLLETIESNQFMV